MAARVTPLSRLHNLKNFDCGDIELNKYLRETARQHQRKYISKTYILAHEHAPADVIGFYTLAIRKMVPAQAFPPGWAKGMPSQVPAFSLARLAVHHTEKHRGYGTFLLFEAMQCAAVAAERVGGYALFVDAKDAQVAAFYRKFGYVPFHENPFILFMPFSDMPP
ncbi:GNAT family N-acetyltransferase [Massilia rubra]|uniref:GNAT family N-acetyltransferase n=1 Tax=Massilia rubra TaxID=2607910 RepID=A0ABX0LZ78_9BURK|nr:GNAT family N-acetyltransferase [Massilia rubra]NHZ37222.1 GNAT family N-acetyltransferase [Massilia rubra]